MPEIFGAALMGGGSGPAYAAISVTYPAGATCTCALGSKTFTAPDTSGQALFIVPTAGDWVVTISQSGKEPVSEVVNVTESAAYTIMLNFSLWIYNAGTDFTSVTGGWQGNGKIIYQFNAADISVQPTQIGGADAGVLCTINKIDLTNYSTLYMDGNNTRPQINALQIAVSDVTDVATSAIANLAWKANYNGVNGLDISKIKGQHYVQIFALTDNLSGETPRYVYRVWLE